MLFSIIVPMYNVESYLDKCINTLLAQEIDDYEIILVDDKSTDHTAKKAKKWLMHSNVKLIQKDYNSGLSATRNVGIMCATGDYIIFVDSDDYVEENFLSKIEGIIRNQNSPDILYFGYYEHDSGNIRTIYGYKCSHNMLYETSEFMKKELSQRNLYAPACFGVYKRSLFYSQECLFREGLLHEDELWTPMILFHSQTVYTSGYIWYHYVRREGSISRAKDKSKSGTDLLYTAKELNIYSNSINDKELRKLFKNHTAKLYMKAVSIGRLYRSTYSKVLDRTFPIKNACFLYDRTKAVLFLLSPKIYCKMNNIISIQ